jgi:hypothetical protein
MALTRIQIVDEALAQAGLDSGYRTRGRTWLNIALEKHAVRTNYKFWRKSADVSFVANQRTYDLPADFKRIDTIFLVDANGNQGAMVAIREPYQAEPFRRDNSYGMPSVAWIDENLDKVQFNSAPSAVSGEKYRINYFKDAPSYSTTDSDDAVTVDFDDQWLLIEEVKLMAMEWSDDERYQSKKADVKEAKIEHQRNMYQSDAHSNIPLNQEVFRPTSRRGRRIGRF